MPSWNLLAFPFAAGLVAAFNPCGFAMLPTYLTYFLGLDSDETSTAKSVLRGAKVGLALTLGFVTVFGIFGILFEVILSGGGRSAVQSSLWVVTIGSGVVVFVLGLAMLRGFQPVLNLPKVQMGTGSRELGSMYLFGVSYGLVSLGCTIGPFLVAVSGSVSNADVAGASLWAFIAYALGMGSVILFLTMALAAGRRGVANKMRSLLPVINRISGVLLVLAGVYLAFYGWFQKDPLNNGNGVVDFVEGIQADVVNFINNDLGAERAGLIMLGLAVLVSVAAFVWKKISGDDDGPSIDSPESTEADTAEMAEV
ncbi:MAG: cytochrome c biogenesis CcdA family protein [Acidimicrobiia bacterium]|nr:cytochrome c biogenesis CcdA family protein [Acidimicrobiia bacterium]